MIDFEEERTRKAARALLKALQELLADLVGLAGEFAICREILGSSHGQAAVAAVAEATGSPSLEPHPPIVVEVRGGVVQDVRNVPPGYDYQVEDYDNLEAEEEEAGRPA